MLQVTLDNYNRFEFKDKVMKRNILTGSSALSINFLLVGPLAACVYRLLFFSVIKAITF